MDLKIYKTDGNKEENGVWRNISGDARVRVARATSPKYRAAIVKYFKEYVPKGIKPEQAQKEVEQATINAMAEAILLGWENITVGGEDLEYSTENALMILTEYPDFREVIASMSQEREPYSPEDTGKK